MLRVACFEITDSTFILYVTNPKKYIYILLHKFEFSVTLVLQSANSEEISLNTNFFQTISTFSCLPQAQRAHESQDFKDTFGSQSFRLSKKKYPIIRSIECHVNKRYRGTLAQSVESWSVEWKPVTGSIPSKKMKRLAFCPANG